MQITDAIADMLTRIRNAGNAGHATVEIPASNLKKAIAQILLDEGYIAGYDVKEDSKQGTITVTLKYAGKKHAISEIKRISKPGLRTQADKENLPYDLGGMGIAIISTSKGVVTDKAARKMGVGGEVLAYVW